MKDNRYIPPHERARSANQNFQSQNVNQWEDQRGTNYHQPYRTKNYQPNSTDSKLYANPTSKFQNKLSFSKVQFSKLW